jgi:hypothetical protein
VNVTRLRRTERAQVQPSGVLFQTDLPQFVLPYEIVRTAARAPGSSGAERTPASGVKTIA